MAATTHGAWVTLCVGAHGFSAFFRRNISPSSELCIRIGILARRGRVSPTRPACSAGFASNRKSSNLVAACALAKPVPRATRASIGRVSAHLSDAGREKTRWERIQKTAQVPVYTSRGVTGSLRRLLRDFDRDVVRLDAVRQRVFGVCRDLVFGHYEDCVAKRGALSSAKTRRMA